LPNDVYEISEGTTITNESPFIFSKSDRTVILNFQWIDDVKPGSTAVIRFKVKSEYMRLEIVKTIEYSLEIKFKV
jgi:hypothetical protein